MSPHLTEHLPNATRPEFRTHPRRPAQLQGRLVSGARGGVPKTVELVDLGPGGAGCLVQHGLVQVGDTVTLAIDSPTHWDPLLVQARACWVRDADAHARSHDGAPSGPAARCGLAFVDVDAATSFSVARLFAALVPR